MVDLEDLRITNRKGAIIIKCGTYKIVSILMFFFWLQGGKNKRKTKQLHLQDNPCDISHIGNQTKISGMRETPRDRYELHLQSITCAQGGCEPKNPSSSLITDNSSTPILYPAAPLLPITISVE